MRQSGLSADTQALMAYQANQKSAGVAYAFWFFLGTFGAHNFYMGSTGAAVVQLILGVLGWFTIWFGFGLLFWIPLGFWLLFDLFTLGGRASQHNATLMARLNSSATSAETPADELAKFASLHKQGAISDVEYEAQKRRLIGEAPAPASVTPSA